MNARQESMSRHSVKSMRINDLHRGSFLIFADKNAGIPRFVGNFSQNFMSP